MIDFLDNVFRSLTFLYIVSFLQLLIAVFLFTRKFEKRSYFYPKLFVVSTLFLITHVIFPEFNIGYWNIAIKNLLAVIEVFVLCLFLYNRDAKDVVLLCTLGITVRQFALNISQAILNIFGIYDMMNFFQSMIQYAIIAVIYFLCAFYFNKFVDLGKKTTINPIRIITILFLSIIIVYIFDIIIVAVIKLGTSVFVKAISALCCFLVLTIVSIVFKQDKLEQDKRIIEEMLYQEYKKQKLELANIDIINMKCHDLKHHLLLLRQNKYFDENYLKELEKCVKMYENDIHTGNAILDLVIAEKKLYCDENNIVLKLMIDGEKLSVLKSEDICSLFGNALDNAMSAIVDYDDNNKKNILVKVYCRDNFLSIHIENYCDKELDFVDGLPVTKKGKLYHGFGVKSMKYIAEKYHGNFSINTINKTFSLNILIPLND